MRWMVPTGGVLDYINVALLLLVLFVVVVGCCCLYPLVWLLSRTKFDAAPFKMTRKGCFILSLWLMGKCFNGASHGYFDTAEIQLSCLLFVAIANLLLTWYGIRDFISKKCACFGLVTNITKVLLLITLIIDSQMQYTDA